MLEHMAHAGSENGALIVTHDQFQLAGISPNLVRPALEELKFLGLIRYERGGRWAGKNTPSRYRLTWLGDRFDSPPTNEWKRVSMDQAEAWSQQRKKHRKALREAAKN
tara:strand:+ start:313 stop:636 length:324 start_codon:yes stop_codon:yes gene_type:complete